MKVEKIEKNKIKIILTFEELHKYDITLTDIKQGGKKAQAFFMALIEEAKLDSSFILNTPDLFIEASTTQAKLFMITITKLNKTNSCASSTYYYISSNAFVFDDIQPLYEISNTCINDKLYMGINTLYKLHNKYILTFSKSTIKNFKFIPSFSYLTEYCTNYYSKPNIDNYLMEHAQVLFEKRALQKLTTCNLNAN